MARLLMTRDGKTFLVNDLKKDFHCQFGFIKKNDLKKPMVKTNTNMEMFSFDAGFMDTYKKIKRAPQIIPRKDIGLIIAETGVNKKSVVLDAGAGSGAVCCFLANIVKTVHAYEIREDFFNIVIKNISLLKLRNIKLENRDITEGITEKNLDLITLDLPNPWDVVDHAKTALKCGGYLVSYSPTVPQVMDFVKKIESTESMIYLRTVEIIEREWEVSARKVRPKSQGIGHSGFLSFVRKV